MPAPQAQVKSKRRRPARRSPGRAGWRNRLGAGRGQAAEDGMAVQGGQTRSGRYRGWYAQGMMGMIAFMHQD